MNDDYLLRLNWCKHKVSYPNTLKSLLGQSRSTEERNLIKLAIELEKYKSAMTEQKPVSKQKSKLLRLLNRNTTTTESWQILSVFVRCSIDENVKTEVCKYFTTQGVQKPDLPKSKKTQFSTNTHAPINSEASKQMNEDSVQEACDHTKDNIQLQKNSKVEVKDIEIKEGKSQLSISENIGSICDLTMLCHKLPKYDSFFYDISSDCHFNTITVLGILLKFQTEYQYQEFLSGRKYGDLRSFDCQLNECIRKIQKIEHQMINMKILKDGDSSFKPLEATGFLNKIIDKLAKHISFLDNNLVKCEQIKHLKEDCINIRDYLRKVVEPDQKIESLYLTGPLSPYTQNYSIEDVELRNKLKKKIFTKKIPLLPVFYDLAFDYINFDE